MTSGEIRTRRLNEPEWEPREVKWRGPGKIPEPGLYWFDGFINSHPGYPESQGRFVALVDETGLVHVLGQEDGRTAAYAFPKEYVYGEWYGPFDCPPWFGGAMLDPDWPKDEGEGGEGI